MNNEINKDFDLVGKYQQDEVNGFSLDVVPQMIDEVIKHKPTKILDCMAGDGNLTMGCLEEYLNRGLELPHVELLELSNVQCAIANERLNKFGVKVFNGDIITMKNLISGDSLFSDNYFDCIMLKSANHEIPFNKQIDLYKNIYRMLKPGGVFINLGFVFDNVLARNAVRKLALCKDELAGFTEATSNRHFLTRTEFLGFMEDAGFELISCVKEFDYNISAERVAKNYFKNDYEKYVIFKGAIENSVDLNSLGLIERTSLHTSFIASGEITKAYKKLPI